MNPGGHSSFEQTGHASCSLLVTQLPVPEASHWKERRAPGAPTVFGGQGDLWVVFVVLTTVGDSSFHLMKAVLYQARESQPS